MLSANMPQLVEQLNRIADVSVHDTSDQLELRVNTTADISEVDDLLCDAVFAEPVQRTATAHGWVIHLNKLDRPRKALSELKVVSKGSVSRYLPGIA